MRDQRLLGYAKSMRRDPTPAEERLWRELRAKRFAGAKFRHQVVYGGYVADFSSRSRRLIIELDGDTHAHQESYDAERTRFLEARGFTVLRFTNADVMGNLAGVLEAIRNWLETAPLPNPLPASGERA